MEPQALRQPDAEHAPVEHPGTVEPRPPTLPVVGARQLIGASFELLQRSTDQVRRASFYIGLIVLGTGAPLALAVWGAIVVAPTSDFFATDGTAITSAADGWFVVLLYLALAGFAVASIDSIGVTVALLGGNEAARPVTLRQAVQRSRMTFWSIVAAAFLISIPTTVVQAVAGVWPQGGFVLGLVLVTLIQSPFVYAQSGIVLGGVGTIESLKRSIRLARARPAAALILAILPSLYGLLLLFGLGAGLDLAVRGIEALGLGADSGPAGVALITILIVTVIFALGTLLFTVAAIVAAPQVVMFIGLTRATYGLDRVRSGGDHDPDVRAPGRRVFRWLTRPLLVGFGVGALGLAGFLASVSG